MFLLVFGRHVGAHGVSIQISISLGKTFLHITSIRKNYFDLNLGESVCLFTFFLFSNSGLYPLKGFDFDFYLFRTDGVTLKTGNSIYFALIYFLKIFSDSWRILAEKLFHNLSQIC